MAKIADLLAAGRTVSYEFFPPKSEAAAKALDEALEDLTALDPSFVSVTYGALGTTRAPTRDLVIRIDGERPFPAMPHLTCVGQTSDDLLVLLEQYRDAGIENVLALAGDPPPDGSDPGGDFTYATELIELARSVGDFSIGVAAFPEIHPRSPDRETDRRLLAEKLALADFAITQFFFEAEHHRRLVEELHELGLRHPGDPGGHAVRERGRHPAHGRCERLPHPRRARRPAWTRSRATRRRCAGSAWRWPPSCARSSSTTASPACTSTR